MNVIDLKRHDVSSMNEGETNFTLFVVDEEALLFELDSWEFCTNAAR